MVIQTTLEEKAAAPPATLRASAPDPTPLLAYRQPTYIPPPMHFFLDSQPFGFIREI
jgi:hypothetical protein